MNKFFLFVAFLLAQFAAAAQTDVKNTMALLQECLNLNTNSQHDVIKLYEQIGVIEYTLANFTQRVKLSELQKVEVKPHQSGFAVDIRCGEENKCISFIKNDTSNTPLTNTSVQFSDAALANTFAENLAALITHYKSGEPAVEKILHKNDQGKVPILGVKRSPDQKEPVAVKTPVAKPADPVETDDEPEVKSAATTPKLSKEERDEARAEKKEELQRKAAERKEAREEQLAEKKQARKNKTNETAEQEDEEADEKINSKSKRKSTKKSNTVESDENAEAEETDTKPSGRQKSKTSGNKLIEDVGDNAVSEDKGKAANDFCAQLQQILQSGKDNKFKSLEGKLTNAENKINDSKIKLKGARKNYLSWFQKERAFISELKSGNDYELVLKDFEAMQTQLDECLGGGWDMEDKSNSEEYAKLKTEVKDVEFKKDGDASMPSIRVIFLETNDKFTMFMRVK